ncbi:OsmC-like protein [Laetiporus sulphureus 93-53]|uniref:OsmC-like protein n=1 Tax=Laetiporus sulphureus 93-53 TaxID=1314785 RepID=A0A165GT94_9APHY|nr:OsmC-like protein [Laetiporus sulphureus 93-53]KZT10780.1 OsmC-like protein [Laetiporus sulphureus 93-53]
MHPSQAALRPLTHRVVTGAIRHMHNPNMPRARGILTLKDHVYFAKATAEGQGRNGIVKSNGDAPLELKMAMPKAIGGKGDGQNPEQLFGMGYASCFLGSLQLMAARAGKKHIAENSKVHTKVYLGHPSDPELEGFGLRVELTVEGCDDDEVIAAAHKFCAYSRALKHGAEVTVNKI